IWGPQHLTTRKELIAGQGPWAAGALHACVPSAASAAEKPVGRPACVYRGVPPKVCRIVLRNTVTTVSTEIIRTLCRGAYRVVGNGSPVNSFDSDIDD